MKEKTNWGKNAFNSISESTIDALSFGNVMRRILYFLFFGVLLGLTKLITALDLVGQQGGGTWGFIKALGISIWYGVGIALASSWDFIVGIANGTLASNNAVGSIIFGGIMFVAIIGFFFQPVSLIINILDMKGRRETGNSSGNATTWIVRLVFTIVVVTILSASFFYSGASESILMNTANPDTNSTSNTTIPIINDTENSDTNNTFINSINLLTG